MLAAVSDAPGFVRDAGGGWRFEGWASPRVRAGLTDRTVDPSWLVGQQPSALVEAEQVHGAGIAVLEGTRAPAGPISGCDGLLTSVPGMALRIRTADCLPIFFADPERLIVGLAHAGWRGLAAQLPVRMVAAFRHAYHSPVSALHVAIGPAIRSCCYEVGPEFQALFGPHVRTDGQRRMCDLIGVAIEQLLGCGVPRERITDSGCCTACDAERWFSLRREGPMTGRLISFVLVKAEDAAPRPA